MESLVAFAHEDSDSEAADEVDMLDRKYVYDFDDVVGIGGMLGKKGVDAFVWSPKAQLCGDGERKEDDINRQGWLAWLEFYEEFATAKLPCIVAMVSHRIELITQLFDEQQAEKVMVCDITALAPMQVIGLDSEGETLEMVAEAVSDEDARLRDGTVAARRGRPRRLTRQRRR